ncbi:unnamed protein product [Rotaria socialis]|uniref:EGF-like domain-containing protein n=1 Tax=Rotaria socialis TaxID=392032 RepID=A0A820I109_9BILA|nr:unnamed protein product [Rotaria socialis]
MLTPLLVTFALIFTIRDGRVLLYNTEKEEAVEKFDCVYYVPNDGEEISYCRRPGGNQSYNRRKNECNNHGEKRLFRHLLNEEIHPNIVLKWISSVEMADLYASVFYNDSFIDDDDDRFVCNCTKSGTFGKYCEYQLTHEVELFSEAIKAQFEQKRTGDSWNTQRYGKIICYETLPCPSSPLCLDWRDICDGAQEYLNGTDEENCDKLEFNECEDDEFRCTNGMCIPEEFWLDGDHDCMDWSDEYYSEHEQTCPFYPKAMECDEHLCVSYMYSCGDGECVYWETRVAFQRVVEAREDCFNKRNLNYMCAVSPHRSTWTLESGLCCPDKDYDDSRYPAWNQIIASNISQYDKCQYLFRFVLSKNFEHNCPCNERNCTDMMIHECQDSERLIVYPPQGLINSNVIVKYNYSSFTGNLNFQYVYLSGSLKCRGYLIWIKGPVVVGEVDELILDRRFNHVLCETKTPGLIYRYFESPHKNHQFCWNYSLTFNRRPYAVNLNMCTRKGECISQYRIRDGHADCWDGQDERMVPGKSYCMANVGRHRFQCYDNNERKCLTLNRLDTGIPNCLNNYDESLYGTGSGIKWNLPCSTNLKTDCHLVKTYIQQSSARNFSSNTPLVNRERQTTIDRISFQQYCDSFWDLEKHVDEMSSSCKYWICKNDEYQCGTGQCIALDWVCDGEWDCSDASDEEAILLNQNSKKRLSRERRVLIPNISFPIEGTLKTNKHQSSKSIINLRNDQSFKVHSYQCNRGIAVVEINETRCLCPPAYYGDWCQFFSDRISIIAHINQTTEFKTISNMTFKIKVNLLFNNRIPGRTYTVVYDGKSPYLAVLHGSVLRS